MKPSPLNPVAYFCAEYALLPNLPLYAGGLGILAGDTIREAADKGFPVVAVGLLYRGCAAIQGVDASGLQYEKDLDVDPVASGFEHVYLPDEDQPLFVKIHLTTKEVWARVWKKQVNQTTVYLLDTDTDQNDPEERGVACQLYGGGDDSLLKQQMILGIGGVKVLDHLKIEPCLYHVNEGRPAFLYWQLIRRFMDNDNLSYREAAEKAKSMIVYTNHTLVRAGNNAYDMEMLKNYALYYAEKMGVSIGELLQPGVDPSTGTFSMTEFALNTSHRASAVSQIHYELCKNVWPEYDWVGITNGVHMPTWQDEDIARCDKTNNDLWWVHMEKKKQLEEFIRSRTGFGYDPNRLVLTWARRIAGYKRPQALYEDMERLLKIVKNEKREVQLLLAGRAHAKDVSAKNILQEIISYFQGELSGRAIYIPNYDIEVSQKLVKGSDVWVNTPVYGQEASGTSGMKAAANGVLQLTVEDGWAAEVEWNHMGWTLDNNALSATMYLRLEDDIVPTFYSRNEEGVPVDWVHRMRKTVAMADYFSTARMLREYEEKLYI